MEKYPEYNKFLKQIKVFDLIVTISHVVKTGLGKLILTIKYISNTSAL